MPDPGPVVVFANCRSPPGSLRLFVVFVQCQDLRLGYHLLIAVGV